MNPFVAAQVQAIIEEIRLLEAFVTAPLGLYSDVRMLRQSIPLPEAAELPQQESQQRRIAYRKFTHDPAHMALQTMEHLQTALVILQSLEDGGTSPLSPEWVSQAHRVLDRAKQRVGGDTRAKTASRIQGLYVIVDPETTAGRPVSEVAEAALKGGARVVQLRDKSNDKGDMLPVARQLRAMCDEHGALFIMNDDPNLALSSEAHGLHIGQSDLPVPEARRVLTPDQILGRSNNTMEEVARSVALGVDYLAVGAIFSTATMGKRARPVVGTEMLARAKETAPQPVVAIGGINLENIAEVVRAGADGVCVVSSVTLADDPEAATSALVEAIENAKT